MDMFARALLTADAILRESEYAAMRRQRYASFDGGDGRRFENGELTFDDLRALATAAGEPKHTSGKQELLEQLTTLYT